MATSSQATSRRHFDSLQQQAFLNLWRTYDRLRSFEDELFARFDLTPQQYNLLRLLRGTRPKPVATLTLANRLVSRAPDITRMLDKLQERGWITRERPEANRRQVLVTITPAGLTLLSRLDQPLRECHDRQLGHLRDGELRELIDLLQKARAPHESDESSWK